MDTRSWFAANRVCTECGYNVVVTQGVKADYRFYCSNPDCMNHTCNYKSIDYLYDDQEPCWIITQEFYLKREFKNG